MSTRAQHGAAAEQLAARFLESKGLRVLGRNLRWRDGELDLVCEHGDTLVFVEVRMRRDGRFGGAAASVGPVKQARLIRAAQHWLADARGFEPAIARSVRFSDVSWRALRR